MVKLLKKMTYDTYKDYIIWKFLKKILEIIFYVMYRRKCDLYTLSVSEKYSKIIRKLNSLKYDESEAGNEWKSFVDNVLYLSRKKNIRSFLTWPPIIASMNVTNSYFLKYEFDYLKGLENWESKWRNIIIKKNKLLEFPFILYPKSTGNLVHHAYLLQKYIEFSGIEFDKIKSIYEFGGGYGVLASLIHRLGFYGKYYIYDFEVFSKLQKYFFELEGLEIIDKINQKKGIFCYSGLDKFNGIKNTRGKDLFLATWSVSESPLEIRNSYMKNLLNYCDGFDYFIIGYQNKFGEINNKLYFEEFKKKFLNTDWYHEEISYLPEHNLLFGKKR